MVFKVNEKLSEEKNTYFSISGCPAISSNLTKRVIFLQITLWK